jgi:hypothetical protein
VRSSTSNLQIHQRNAEGVYGSKCTKKFLVSNTEFTKEPIWTASTQYQELKIDQLKNQNFSLDVLTKKIAKVLEKSCLCENLGVCPSNHFLKKLSANSVCFGHR